MSKYLALATELFNGCESGKGSAPFAAHILPDAVFECDAIADVKTVNAYFDWMLGFNTQISNDFKYTILSVGANDTDVTFVANFTATNTGPGGPVPATGKSTHGMYTYTFRFNSDGKVTKMIKVFDIYTAFKGFGWPLP